METVLEPDQVFVSLLPFMGDYVIETRNRHINYRIRIKPYGYESLMLIKDGQCIQVRGRKSCSTPIFAERRDGLVTFYTDRAGIVAFDHGILVQALQADNLIK